MQHWTEMGESGAFILDFEYLYASLMTVLWGVFRTF